MLDISTQQSLRILFRILCNLLKLIDSNNTRLIRYSQIMKNFIQSRFRRLDIAQFQIPCGIPDISNEKPAFKETKLLTNNSQAFCPFGFKVAKITFPN